MKIAVVAANGRSGQAFVKAALAAGHQIRAGIYSDAGNYKDTENIAYISCNATSQKDVTSLITGQDAVVSFIGHVPGSANDVQTDSIANIIKCMESMGINRLVSLTGTGVRFEGDKTSLIDKILNLSIRIIDPKRVNDGINHAQAIRQSSLDWTILRVLKLGNGNKSNYSLSSGGPAKILTSRHEVAMAVLEVLQQNSYIRQAPIVSKHRA